MTLGGTWIADDRGMPGTHEPIDESELPIAGSFDPFDPDDERDGTADREPGAPEADDREHRVVHRPNPLPSREEDEEELAESDILEALDALDDEFELDDDDDRFR
jgi:hypothetical protein